MQNQIYFNEIILNVCHNDWQQTFTIDIDVLCVFNIKHSYGGMLEVVGEK